jgi:hypothetical protein
MGAKANTLRPATLDGDTSGTTQSPGHSGIAGGPVTLPVPLTLHRDPTDIKTILSLTWMGLLFAVLLLMSVGLNIYQYMRRPDRIVVDRSSGRVLMINDREYGATDAVQLGPDRLTADDKKYISREFIRLIYGIDPATRVKDMEQAIRMMVPGSAVKFARWLKETGILDKQRAESWQTVWTEQNTEVDRTDPYLLRILGRQQITKLVSGAAQQETRLLSLTLKLAADPQGRADHNKRTGFLVAWFDEKEVESESSPTVSQ